MATSTTSRTPAVATPARTKPAARRQIVDAKARWFNGFCVSVLVVFAVIWALPLVWAAVTSLRPEGEIAVNPAAWWSGSWTFDAYAKVLGTGDIQNWYLNSFVAAAVTAILAVVVCSMAGFALSQTKFRGRRWLFALIGAGLVIPPQVLIVPLFNEFNTLHLLNTYWALILQALPAPPIAVFVFAAFFRGIPAELAESAHVDGASWFRIYQGIYMPLTRPAVSAVFIFQFVWSWNNFLWPLLVMTNTRMMTLPVGLSQVSSAYGIHYAQIMASAVLGALPLLLVFVIFQRRIVEGVATTGFK
ncbi:carbohydrate ABC transporter permease [Fodinicola acaciae]|uniref:carbohydrate ABC transporter permease n=1 Tax=Fodinicola acaciae TaxID=2681555 RepID=UPI0013D0F067|nr:carbohydrate ABC transporter permease [Fodinicola acaciae]